MTRRTSLPSTPLRRSRRINEIEKHSKKNTPNDPSSSSEIPVELDDSNEIENDYDEHEESENEVKAPKRKLSKKKKVRVQVNRAPRKGARNRKGNPDSSALLSLSRKVLYSEEKVSDENDISCLIASVILSTQPLKADSNLNDLCSSLVTLYKDDPNAAQCSLLNFLFRSVGGSLASNINAEEVTLGELDNEAWATIVTDLVDEMRHTPLDRIAFHADSAIRSDCAGYVAFHELYGKFWCTFASVAMEQGPMATSQNRFDSELIRDVILRLMELVGVGQPDIRHAATMALLHCGEALLDKTLTLQSKIDVSQRQLNSSTGKKKSESLKNAIASLKRTQSTMEEIVKGNLIQGVFVHRYRDSNPWIRVTCLKCLSKMLLQRPDIFLCDTYLKYFGWMISDKHASVRSTAIYGLLVPFEILEKTIDSSLMENVIVKFLNRIADTVIDIDLNVQEAGMKLLLQLLRRGLLDDVDNEHLWNQINLRVIAEDTNAVVRKYALYFVMEQLEAFDEGGDEKTKKMKNNVSESMERCVSLRIEALASWLAHTLSDGPIPIDNIKIDLVDYVVHSLREMPEHSSIATNWSALLRCIMDDNIATLDGATAGDRTDVVKQRVLVQMLSCAAKAEVGSIASVEFLQMDIDPASVSQNQTKRTKKDSRRSHTHESLSIALLTALPKLFTQFQSDSVILLSLSSLPRYLIPTVFSFSQRKNDFLNMLKNLSQIFSFSTDRNVLFNTALSLSYLSQGEHSRTTDVIAQLQTLVHEGQSRILLLLKEPVEEDNEISLSINLMRFFILAKRCSRVLEFVGGDDVLEEVTQLITNSLSERLDKTSQKDIKTSSIVENGLGCLMILLSWRLYQEHERNGILRDISQVDNLVETDYEDHVIVRIRNRVIKLTEECFRLFAIIHEEEDSSQDSVLNNVIGSIQLSACRIASDLRILFPKSWAEAKHPLLRTLALTDDGRLIGGSIRFIRSKDDEFQSDPRRVHQLLFPLGRSLATNWSSGHRREAGIALSHITGSGEEAGAITCALSKILKKMEPVRFLEAHMACLRQSYVDWLLNEPQLDNDRPTDSEMAAFEEAEQNHIQEFLDLESQSARLSQSLGVGKLSVPNLAPALLAFMLEGIRFSFDTSDEDELMIGSRLSFLRVLGKYVNWVRRNKNYKNIIQDSLDEQENALRQHPEFQDVHQDDLDVLTYFRVSLGMKPSARSVVTPTTPLSVSDEVSALQTPGNNTTITSLTKSYTEADMMQTPTNTERSYDEEESMQTPGSKLNSRKTETSYVEEDLMQTPSRNSGISYVEEESMQTPVNRRDNSVNNYKSTGSKGDESFQTSGINTTTTSLSKSYAEESMQTPVNRRGNSVNNYKSTGSKGDESFQTSGINTTTTSLTKSYAEESMQTPDFQSRNSVMTSMTKSYAEEESMKTPNRSISSRGSGNSSDSEDRSVQSQGRRSYDSSQSEKSSSSNETFQKSISKRSMASSVRSKLSSVNSLLSPLMEEQRTSPEDFKNSNSSNESLSPKKRKSQSKYSEHSEDESLEKRYNRKKRRM